MSQAGSAYKPSDDSARPFSRLSFTLIEITIVIVIIGLICGLVLPRLGRLPRRLVIESALSAVRCAFRDAGVRARATGQSVKLVLDVEGHQFRVENAANSVSHGLPGVGDAPPDTSPTDSDTPPPPSILNKLSTYELSKDVAWHTDELVLGPDEALSYSFFPDGAATGPAIEFTIRKTRFRLDVDRLTGHCMIDELSDY